jgi:signal transduction histidine kinase
MDHGFTLRSYSHMEPARRPPRSARLLALSTVGTVVVFALASVVAIVDANAVGRALRELTLNMLAGIELVSTLAVDVDQERLLVDAHIFEKRAVDMEATERRIAVTRADFERAARAYDLIATLPGEREAWLRLREDAGALESPITHVLALSRLNHDEEARSAMTALEPQFDALSRDVAALVALNHAAAERTAAGIRARLHSGPWRLALLMAAGVALAIAISIGSARALASRELQLTEASDALEQRNRELDAFAGRVAHDLRAPLTALVLSGEDAERRKRSVLRMERLIEDLLVLSRLGVQEPNAACDPSTVTRTVLEELAPQATKLGAHVQADVAAASVSSSAGLLRQALWNLVDNALKYRREGVTPELELRGRVESGAYVLRVRDNGMGMPPDEARRAFDPFFRSPRTKQKPGTGLGLSIVRRVVEAGGGTVSVESEPDRGSLFVMRLKLA